MEDSDVSPVHQTYSDFSSKLKNWLRESRQFWSTRRAILKREALWDYAVETRVAAGYFRPWKFNAVQTAVAGGIATLVGKLLDVLSPNPESALTGNPEFDRLLESALRWLTPFTVPILLTAFVFLMGWGSLKRSDSTPQRRARARAAYLYLDGAYGFWSQLCLAVFLTVVFSHLWQSTVAPSATLIGPWWALLLFYVLAAWQLYIVGSKIPKLLFGTNGYSTRARRFWQRRLSDDPPWNKLVLANLISIVPLFVGLQLTVFAVAYAFAYLISGIRHLLR
jgi:hypothetical protein